ncbi:hypothetical protein CVU83_00895 [Candidatus Falkowbacteria bacterium HGW-Falkowbacteria-2]|uniref:Uncharacterized protein n=1 Tax=Candidatus Falkowbacteria bacterium HGW-Falkowbacteria-2 TaxID=2013769 RepID=A0A2N2E2E8_9BACT|nr:MAG: hypothetical protein CVU83_00895 [Candidatus Falkowbacteria bacterium HGW-Falkowbacteria-2]
MRDTEKAFLWIVNLLRQHRIRFRISGGLAANVYGTKRVLADIDIEVESEAVKVLFGVVKEYVTYGPKMYKDKEFNLLLMTLKYKGQEIDICGIDDLKYFNKQTGQWETQKVKLSSCVRRKVYNRIVPIIPLKDLITYKKKLMREVDIEDVNVLTSL